MWLEMVSTFTILSNFWTWGRRTLSSSAQREALVPGTAVLDGSLPASRIKDHS